ncbi:hypothetical protein D9758_001566 [Tetrapyrgos nigripes]|uniref:Uncharacterized protein n=1 Tax=Tetrapyrgos nigripes TaxID=182062 RepID=A0A8H5GY25_9AGAR|nr:hypothetical protein D9758_001566 [Tetrapyrgos nigripes]
MASTSRRIRFAPLPDPRRLVLVTDDGAELPLTPDPESKLDPDAPDGDADPVCIPAYFSLQALSPKPSSPCPSTLVSGSATSESSEPSSSSSSSASSMHSLTPTQSIEPSVTAGSRTPTQSNQSSFKPRRNTDLFAKITSKKLTAEQILTLGAINLFKSNKGKNKAFAEDVPPSAWGSSLTRWTSGGSAHSFGAPLSRSQSTQSTQTYKGGNVRKKPRSSSASATDSSKNAARANGLISTLHDSSGKRGNKTRMLNGRVYGARRGSGKFSFPTSLLLLLLSLFSSLLPPFSISFILHFDRMRSAYFLLVCP